MASVFFIFLPYSFLPLGLEKIWISNSAALCRSFDALSGSNLFLKLMPAVSVVAFAAWGLDPLIRLSRAIFLNVKTSL